MPHALITGYSSVSACQADARVTRVKRRLAESMGPHGEPQGFCGLKPIKNPPEAYFAVEGDEEKLSPASGGAGKTSSPGRSAASRKNNGAGGAGHRRALLMEEEGALDYDSESPRGRDLVGEVERSAIAALAESEGGDSNQRRFAGVRMPGTVLREGGQATTNFGAGASDGQGGWGGGQRPFLSGDEISILPADLSEETGEHYAGKILQPVGRMSDFSRGVDGDGLETWLVERDGRGRGEGEKEVAKGALEPHGLRDSRTYGGRLGGKPSTRGAQSGSRD